MSDASTGQPPTVSEVDVEAPEIDECCATWARPDALANPDLPNGHDHRCPVGSTALPAATWQAIKGRGFLCSTEF